MRIDNSQDVESNSFSSESPMRNVSRKSLDDASDDERIRKRELWGGPYVGYDFFGGHPYIRFSRGIVPFLVTAFFATLIAIFFLNSPAGGIARIIIAVVVIFAIIGVIISIPKLMLRK